MYTNCLGASIHSFQDFDKETKILDQTIGPTLFRALAMVDVYDISLVQQCLLLEDHFSIKATQACLQDPKAAVSTAKDYFKQLLEIDLKLSLQRAEGHLSLKHILEVSKKISWMKVFDMALNHGTKGTRTVQSIMKMLSVPLYGHRKC